MADKLEAGEPVVLVCPECRSQLVPTSDATALKCPSHPGLRFKTPTS